MTPIRPVKPRPMFLRKGFDLWWLPPTIGICLAVAGIFALFKYTPFEGITIPVLHSTSVQEHISADGKVVCYSRSGALACLPVWLLDKPNNWVVAYPQSRPTGKVAK